MHKKSHFNHQDALGHLKQARLRGHEASQEDHGTESPGYFSSAIDATKETAIVLLLLWITLNGFHLIEGRREIFSLFGTFILGWLLWKMGRGAIIGWSRLSRLNRLMREEKHEIESNPDEEREELTALYKAKGFSGELLDRVIDVLMSDDHKLLVVMLEEEFGVSLEKCDHPLKQSLGAGVGSFISMCVMLIGYLISPLWGVFVSTYLLVFISAYMAAKIERLHPLPFVIWNVGIVFLATVTTHFLIKFLWS
jgi:VIT1/CCC1 family predicted Fe2+/Mn2+ transporter